MKGPVVSMRVQLNRDVKEEVVAYANKAGWSLSAAVEQLLIYGLSEERTRICGRTPFKSAKDWEEE